MNIGKSVQLAGLGALLLLGACDTAETIDAEERGGLLYGLELEDVEQIHAEYLEDEDLQITVDRLTAPFDCSLYGDLCDLVGRDGAEELTAEIVDLALDGVPSNDIDAHIDARVDELAALAESESDDITHRAQSPYAAAVSASGTHRIRANSGVFTPVVGMRTAWTRVLSESNFYGSWVPHRATALCVDAGTNTQTVVEQFGTNPATYTLLESENPMSMCVLNAYSFRRRTFHERNNGVSLPASQQLPAYSRRYMIRSVGSATGTLAGSSLSVYSPGHTEYF